MEEIRWEAVQTILWRALDLSMEERRSAVRAMCKKDIELFDEVMELLEEDARNHSLLDSNVRDAARGMLELGLLPSLIQRQIGPYRLLSLLGEGGMGVVYLAERTDIGGKVAIKLLRDAWLSPMRRERFRVEQQTLAQLNHSSIARIFDSNTLEDGTPWFVMEYAEGLPLTEYWRARAGTPGECLQLMRKVCEAVQYAHSHAIIHRDIKPSNILVSEDGNIKLLDFGIAKHINFGEASDHPTVTGLRLMTLSYAAPEQLTGGAVGMYTDVCALGMLLFELLTGRLPIRKPGNPTIDADESRERPSVVIRRDNPEYLKKLGKNEWTDLDSLTLKALAFEVGQRYSTVDAMMRDIDAFQSGRPLEARPPEWQYTLNKFIRRNRMLLVTAAASLFFVTATGVLYTVRIATVLVMRAPHSWRPRFVVSVIPSNSINRYHSLMFFNPRPCFIPYVINRIIARPWRARFGIGH
jgi:serine/threonine protein kinase